MLIGLVLYLAAGALTPASTQTPSMELALAGRRSFEAMVCAGYAESSGNRVEQKRLADLGLAEGRRFLGGVQANQVTADDRQSTIPLLFGLIMAGPSIDFILGRFWEAASSYASDRIWEYDASSRDRAHSPDEGTRKVNAERFYDEGNCSSLR